MAIIWANKCRNAECPIRAMAVTATPKLKTVTRVNMSPAQNTTVTNNAPASKYKANRFSPMRRDKTSMTAPAIDGPSRPPSKTIMRSKSLPLKVWARPESPGVMIMLSNRPPDTMAPSPWPSSCTHVDSKTNGRPSMGILPSAQTRNTKIQNPSGRVILSKLIAETGISKSPIYDYLSLVVPNQRLKNRLAAPDFSFKSRSAASATSSILSVIGSMRLRLNLRHIRQILIRVNASKLKKAILNYGTKRTSGPDTSRIL